MKKIDILNFITDFRKVPNQIKTLSEIRAHLGAGDEAGVGMRHQQFGQFIGGARREGAALLMVTIPLTLLTRAPITLLTVMKCSWALSLPQQQRWMQEFLL